jgi:endonuclease/exonuclease/phosphatase family metal-dependent hydrolase
VALGDFNCEPGESIHEVLASLGFANAMATAGGGVGPTFDSTGRMSVAIDHIYVSPALRPALSCAETIRAPGFHHDGPLPDGAWLHSDHVPLIAELEVA